jgi:exonuclease III
VLRIDYLLASPELRPLNVSSDCTPRGSDHCLVNALLELP